MEQFQDEFVFTNDDNEIKHKPTIEDRLLELRESNERIVQKLDKYCRQLREKDFKDTDLKSAIFLGKKPNRESRLKKTKSGAKTEKQDCSSGIRFISECRKSAYTEKTVERCKTEGGGVNEKRG